MRFASAAILLLWALFPFTGQNLALILARFVGPTLLRSAQGKFTDVNVFIYMRLKEALLLLTAAWVLAILCWFGSRVLKAIVDQKYAWVWISALWLVALNVFVLLGMHTALFLMGFWHGETTNSYVQQQFKQHLLAETPRPRALLIGSSQTRAEIDEAVLNRELAGRLWTTELHFPGSRAFDLWLVIRRLRPQQGDVIICYLSEGYFFTGTASQCLPYYLRWTDLDELTFRSTGDWWKQRNCYYGILGNCLPVFRLKDAFSQRFLGATIIGLEQVEYNQSLSIDLEQRAKTLAEGLTGGKTAAAQKHAFRAFIDECRKFRVKLVLCVGQLNPLVYNYAAPGYRQDYLAFLEEIQKSTPQIALLTPEVIGWHTSETYLDVAHITREEQAKFSRRISTWLSENVDRLQALE